MWYRSTVTNKIIHDSVSKVINAIYGKDAFQSDIEKGYLVPVEDLSVIDVLRDTHSTHLAILRYCEIHNCPMKDAKPIVKKMREDLPNFNRRKGYKKQWKKRNVTAETAASENQPDMDK